MSLYERLYVEFLYYFNVERDYFECHECLEELWLEEGRNPLYQGLLQVAVGLYHYRNANAGGAVKLWDGALEKLRPYPERTLGIDLGKLRNDVDEYAAKLRNIAGQPVPFYDLDIAILDQELLAAVEALKRHPPAKRDEESP